MADLIDREELKNIVEEWGNSYSIFPSILEDLYCKIDNKPPADTERHAHWKNKRSLLGGFVVNCSNCGETLGYIGENRTPHNYCPGCGCRMDEVKNEQSM